MAGESSTSGEACAVAPHPPASLPGLCTIDDVDWGCPEGVSEVVAHTISRLSLFDLWTRRNAGCTCTLWHALRAQVPICTRLAG